MYGDFAGLCREAENNGAGLWRAVLDREMYRNSLSEEEILTEVGRCLEVMMESSRFTEPSDGERISCLLYTSDRVVDVNLKGTFFVCSRAIPELEKTGGCIVNISSDAGIGGNRCV